MPLPLRLKKSLKISEECGNHMAPPPPHLPLLDLPDPYLLLNVAPSEEGGEEGGVTQAT